MFTYVKTCERGRIKDFEQLSCAYNAVRYNGFFQGPRRLHYNGVAVYTVHDVYQRLVFCHMSSYIPLNSHPIFP